MKITAKECAEIEALLKAVKQDVKDLRENRQIPDEDHYGRFDELVIKAELMVAIINDIRTTVVCAEDPEVIEDIAQQLGATNRSD